MILSIAYLADRDEAVRAWWSRTIPRVELGPGAPGTIGCESVVMHAYDRFRAEEIAAIQGAPAELGIRWAMGGPLPGFAPVEEE
jgi:hypothetical protein